MNPTIKNVAILAFGLLATTQSKADWVDGNKLPWNPVNQPGNQSYSTSNATLSNGVWTLKATQPGDNGKKYKSGVIYETRTLKLTKDKAIGAQATINVNNAKVRGTWPAFWITTAKPWTAEVDIAEWKGSSTVWQNTRDGVSGTWQAKKTVSTSGVYKAHIAANNDTKADTTDAKVSFYIDGNWTVTHTASGFVGKTYYVLANLQMEGSGGSPGPSTASFTIRNISVWGF